MAGWVQDGGGQQGFYNGYHSDWYSGANPFASSTNNIINNQNSILNTNDDAFMNSFFNDPDAAPATDGMYDMNWHMMDEKPNGIGLGAHWDAQTIDPTTTTTETFTASYRTHSDHNPNRISQPTAAGLDHLQQTQNSDPELQGANDLFAMAVNSHSGAQDAQPFGNSAIGLWSNFGGHHAAMHMQEQLKSPITSPNGQSMNSYHHPTQSPVHSYRNGFNPHQIATQHQRQQLNTRQHLPNDLRLRHQSLPGDPNFAFFPPEALPRTPQSAFLPGQSTSRPPLMHFGSDPNFQNSGYTGLRNHIPPEQEKGANLNGVPFAHQLEAAARGHLHVSPVTPVTASHYGRLMFPDGVNTYAPASTSSSPNTLGGLPSDNMAPTANRHAHPQNSAVRATTVAAGYEGDSDADGDFEDTQPRKRRKSRLEEDDEDEYTPGKHHVRAPASKRGSKSTKVAAFDGSDDDDGDYVEGPSSTKASVKRRKSSTNARPSLGSSQSGSPAAMASPSGRPAASGKKKVRGSQPRTNLTEDEKRRNHIASEKTRRDLIKLQYDQLDGMVPALKEGKSGLSRSDILKEIAAFVEGTLEGNKKIEDMVSRPPPGSRYGGYG